MPPFTPGIGIALSKILADLGGAFAGDNSVQSGLAEILSSSAAGGIKAQGFNRQNDKLSAELLGIINNGAEVFQLEGLRPRDAVQNVVPGGRSLADVGLTDPSSSRIDPIAALALGGQGVEDTIRTRQQERFRVERVLERENDLANRIKAVELSTKNKAAVERLKLENAALLDEARGGPQQRAANFASTVTSTEATRQSILRQPSPIEAADAREREAFALDVTTKGKQTSNQAATLSLESAPTQDQAGQLTAANIKQKQAQANISESDAATRDELNQAAVDLANLKAQRTPSDLASAQRGAIKQVAPGMLRQLRRRLGENSAELDQASEFLRKLGGGEELDEAGRRSTFASLIALLTPEELDFFETQLVAAESAILKGQSASTAVSVGSVPPLIEDITELSIGQAQEEADFLNRR